MRTQAAFYPHFLEPRLAPGEELTPTELQILHLLCADKSNAEIAQIMDVKLPTVKTHVSHILEKLDVKRRAEAKTAAKKLHLSAGRPVKTASVHDVGFRYKGNMYILKEERYEKTSIELCSWRWPCA